MRDNTKFYTLESGKSIGKQQFIHYFEKKVFKTIFDFKLIDRKDKTIGVAASGGKDSNAVLVALKHFIDKYKNTNLISPEIELIAVSVDEGIPSYRKRLLAKLHNLTKKLGIKHNTFTFKEEFGKTLKQIEPKIKKLGLTNCYVCSILKRWLINKKLKQIKADKIATGHTIDDEAETILLNQLKGNTLLLAKLGPKTGIIKIKGFVQRIKPLYEVTTKEIIAYNKALNLLLSLDVCPLRHTTLRVEIRKWLSHLEKDHLEVKRAIVKSFLNIMSLLKKKYSTKITSIKRCKICGQPSSQDICKACQLRGQLGLV